MSCQRAAELMSLALEEEATPEERQELQAHLASCEACAAEWYALQAVESLLIATLPVEPPETLATDILQGVARCRQRARSRQRLRSLLYMLAICWREGWL